MGRAGWRRPSQASVIRDVRLKDSGMDEAGGDAGDALPATYTLSVIAVHYFHDDSLSGMLFGIPPPRPRSACFCCVCGPVNQPCCDALPGLTHRSPRSQQVAYKRWDCQK